MDDGGVRHRSSMGRSEVLHEGIRTATVHCARRGEVMDMKTAGWDRAMGPNITHRVGALLILRCLRLSRFSEHRIPQPQ